MRLGGPDTQTDLVGLDTFCCEGAATKGYERAGFLMHGVDKVARFGRRYPGQRGFTAGDALDYIARYGWMYRFIHASPPCQPYSIATAGNPAARAKHDRLIAVTREALNSTGRPWVLENVALAGKEMLEPVTLCGTMEAFKLWTVDEDGTKLEMWRHRLFETGGGFTFEAPGPCRHHWYSRQVAGSYGGARRDKVEARKVRHGGYVPAKHVQERLLGVDWMTQHGLYQSIPPAYTEHIGHALAASC